MVTLLFFMPSVVPWTFKEMLHEALAARVPAERLTEPEPAVAVVVPVQVVVNPLGVATISPAGRVSIKDNPVSEEAALGLLMLNVNDVVPLSVMLPAPKVLVMLGGLATVTLAVEVFPVPPSVEVTCTLLFFTPDVVPCTFTEKVHVALAAKVAVARLTEPVPAVAVIAPPPHVPVRPLGVATTRPAGRVSVNATFVRLVPALGFVMYYPGDVVSDRNDAAPKDLRMDAPWPWMFTLAFC